MDQKRSNPSSWRRDPFEDEKNSNGSRLYNATKESRGIVRLEFSNQFKATDININSARIAMTPELRKRTP
jgi:hypothetical protein